MYLQYKNKTLSLFALLFLSFFIFLEANQLSLSETCAAISPIQYKVKEGTSNFSFTFELQARFVGDTFIRNCSFGFLIEDLICVDLVQTICCCNSFVRKSSAICRIPTKITADTKYLYQGLAQLQGSTGTLCSGVVSIVIDKEQLSSNLGMIIGIVGGVVILIIVGVVLYRKFIKNKGQKQSKKNPNKDNSQVDYKKSLIHSNSNKSVPQKQSITSKQSIGSDKYDKIEYDYQEQIKIQKQKQENIKRQKQRAQQYERYLFEKQRERRDYEEFLKQRQAKEKERYIRERQKNSYDSRNYEVQRLNKPYNQNSSLKKDQIKKQPVPDLENKQLSDSLIAKHYNHRDSYQ